MVARNEERTVFLSSEGAVCERCSEAYTGTNESKKKTREVSTYWVTFIPFTIFLARRRDERHAAKKERERRGIVSEKSACSGLRK